MRAVASHAFRSYYEFKHPMADRLTDEAWRAMDPRLDSPAWIGNFTVK